MLYLNTPSYSLLKGGLQTAIKEILNTEVDMVPINDYRALISQINSGDYDAYLISYAVPPYQSPLYSLKDKPYQLGLSGSAIEYLDRRLNSASNITQQRLIYMEYQKVQASKALTIPLITIPRLFIVSKNLHNVELGSGEYLFKEAWTWKKGR